MPKDGVQLSPPENLLTSFEIYLLASLFVRHGVSKIRLTGGEPTVRRDIIDIVRALWSLRHKGLQDLCMTTNGLALHRKLDQLVDAGLNGINLSLDTLDPRQFELLTRRNGLSAVMQTLERLLDLKARGRLANLKVNSVIMRGVNEDQVIPLANLSKENNLEVRFIEYMPFSGNAWDRRKMIPHKETLDSLRSKYPGLGPAKTPANSTSRLFEVPGHRGRIGFITSMTDDFCSTCNRLRITSDGNLKVCLFGNSEISLKDIIRKHTNNYPSEYKSISTVLLGGEQSSARLDSLRENVKKELLQAVHSALQRKKEKHAGLGALENMKNRPMILIASKAASFNAFGALKSVSSNGENTAPKKLTAKFPSKGIEGKLFGLTRPTIRAAEVLLFQTKHIFSPGLKFHLIRSQPAKSSSWYNHQANILPPWTIQVRCYSMRAGSDGEKKLKDASFEKGYNTSTEIQNDPSLSHLDQHGDARMVSVSNKAHTKRIAVAVCSVRFSVAGLTTMIERHLIKKGDVLSVARVAGIMGAKLTANIIPLCHPIPLTHVHVNTKLISPQCRKSSSDQPRKTEDFGMGQYGGVMIEARVECVGQTGVEMEALCAANIAGMTIYDMCKGVDKHMCIDGSLVVLKRGGASPDWTAPGWRPLGDVKGHDGDREDMIHDTS